MWRWLDKLLDLLERIKELLQRGGVVRRIDRENAPQGEQSETSL